MKKYIMRHIVCLIILLSLLGCSTTSPLSETQQTDATSYLPTQDSVNHDVPKHPEFHTLSEIKSFLDVSNASGDSSANEKEMDTICDYVPQSSAENISEIASSLLFPVTVKTELGATYFEEYQSLDLIYVIDGVQYRFIYFFESDYVWNVEEDPAVQNVMVGPYRVDFWKLDHPNFAYQYYGFVKTDRVYLRITVLGENVSDFSFDAFDFVPLSSIGGGDVA